MDNAPSKIRRESIKRNPIVAIKHHCDDDEVAFA